MLRVPETNFLQGITRPPRGEAPLLAPRPDQCFTEFPRQLLTECIFWTRAQPGSVLLHQPTPPTPGAPIALAICGPHDSMHRVLRAHPAPHRIGENGTQQPHRSVGRAFASPHAR